MEVTLNGVQWFTVKYGIPLQIEGLEGLPWLKDQ